MSTVFTGAQGSTCVHPSTLAIKDRAGPSGAVYQVSVSTLAGASAVEGVYGSERQVEQDGICGFLPGTYTLQAQITFRDWSLLERVLHVTVLQEDSSGGTSPAFGGELDGLADLLTAEAGLTAAAAAAVIGEMDSDGNGSVSLAEFVAWWGAAQPGGAAKAALARVHRTSSAAEVFAALDSNGSGTLAPPETLGEELEGLAALLRSGGLSAPEAAAAIAAMDSNGDGSVSRLELAAWWDGAESSQAAREALAGRFGGGAGEAFAALDADGSGGLGPPSGGFLGAELEGLAEVLQSRGGLDEAAAAAVIAEMDRNSDWSVSREEFTAWWASAKNDRAAREVAFGGVYGTDAGPGDVFGALDGGGSGGLGIAGSSAVPGGGLGEELVGLAGLLQAGGLGAAAAASTIAYMDSNGDGGVSLAEFADWWDGATRDRAAQAALRASSGSTAGGAFTALDSAGAGQLAVGAGSPLVALLQSRAGLSAAEAAAVAGAMDSSGDGSVSQEEFAAWWDGAAMSGSALGALEGGGAGSTAGEVFAALDADSSGVLGTAGSSSGGQSTGGMLGLAYLLQSAGLSPGAAAGVMGSMDGTGDGTISRDEFTAWWEATETDKPALAALEGLSATSSAGDAFAALDANASGGLGTPGGSGSSSPGGAPSGELEALAEALQAGAGLSAAAAAAAVADMDGNRDGSVSQEEFAAWWDGSLRSQTAREALIGESGLTSSGEVFAALDTNGSGGLGAPALGELESLAALLRGPSSGGGLSAAAAAAVIAEMGSGSGGGVSRAEFAAWWAAARAAGGARAALEGRYGGGAGGVFAALDSAGSGSVAGAGLAGLVALLQSSAGLSQAEAAAAVAAMDSDGDGQLTAAEFEAWWGAAGTTAAALSTLESTYGADAGADYVFSALDANSSGSLGASSGGPPAGPVGELEALADLLRAEAGLDAAEAAAVIADMDSDGDFAVTLAEFQQWWDGLTTSGPAQEALERVYGTGNVLDVFAALDTNGSGSLGGEAREGQLVEVTFSPQTGYLYFTGDPATTCISGYELDTNRFWESATAEIVEGPIAGEWSFPSTEQWLVPGLCGFVEGSYVLDLAVTYPASCMECRGFPKTIEVLLNVGDELPSPPPPRSPFQAPDSPPGGAGAGAGGGGGPAAATVGVMSMVTGESATAISSAEQDPDAKLSTPRGSEASPDGHYVYILDSLNFQIKRTDLRSGATEVVAGTGERGAEDGPAASASFGLLQGNFAVVQDFDAASGTYGDTFLYVTDTDNRAVRKIHVESGQVSTLGGPPAPAGGEVAARLAGLLQSSGGLTAAEASAVVARMDSARDTPMTAEELTAWWDLVERDGVARAALEDLHGGGSGGVFAGLDADGSGGLGASELEGLASSLQLLAGLTAAEAGSVVAAMGAGADGVLPREDFEAWWDAAEKDSSALAALEGLDTGNTGGEVFLALDTKTPESSQWIFNQPLAGSIAAEKRVMYVPDKGDYVVYRLDLDDTLSASSAPPGIGLQLRKMLQTGKDVVRPGSQQVLAGNFVPGCVDGTGSGAQLLAPTSSALTSTGRLLYLLDGPMVRQVATASGAVVTVAGSCSSRGPAADGTGTAAVFGTMLGMSLSADDSTLYIAGSHGQSIRYMDTASKAVVTLAGSGATNAGNVVQEGTGTAVAMFNMPYTVSVSPDGRFLYVADSNNNAIKRVTTGRVTNAGPPRPPPPAPPPRGSGIALDSPPPAPAPASGGGGDSLSVPLLVAVAAGTVVAAAGAAACALTLLGAGRRRARKVAEDVVEEVAEQLYDLYDDLMDGPDAEPPPPPRLPATQSSRFGPQPQPKVRASDYASAHEPPRVPTPEIAPGMEGYQMLQGAPSKYLQMKLPPRIDGPPMKIVL